MLGLAVAGGTPANAQDTSVTPVATASISATMFATQTATPKKQGAGLKLVKALIAATAQVTHLTPTAVTEALGNGKTFNQIATDNKADPAAIQTAAIAALTTEINDAVTSGKITQTQADMLTKHLDKVVGKAMDRVIATQKTPAIRKADAAITNLLFQETAKVTGLSQRDLLQVLRSGQTLTQVATAHNIDPATIVSAANQSATTYINKRLKNTKLSQADATALLAALPGELNTLMNKPNLLGNHNPQPTDAQTGQDATPSAVSTAAATPSL